MAGGWCGTKSLFDLTHFSLSLPPTPSLQCCVCGRHHTARCVVLTDGGCGCGRGCGCGCAVTVCCDCVLRQYRDRVMCLWLTSHRSMRRADWRTFGVVVWCVYIGASARGPTGSRLWMAASCSPRPQRSPPPPHRNSLPASALLLLCLCHNLKGKASCAQTTCNACLTMCFGSLA